jgi:protein TonB
VTKDGKLVDCIIVSETPRGAGFGRATIAASRYFKMRPQTKDGVPVDGGKVIIPLRWQLGGE